MSNQRHVLFVDNLIKRKFNGTKAYMDTYPDASYETARRNSSILLLTNADIKDLIEVKLNEIDIKDIITIEHVLKNLEKEAQTAKNSGDRIRANELCGKYLSMFTEKMEIEHTLPTPQKSDSLLKAINRLN